MSEAAKFTRLDAGLSPMSITGRFRQVVSFHGGRITISTYKTREMKDPNWLGPGGGEQEIKESGNQEALRG